MWEADFDTVDEAISDGFEEDKRLVVLWVEDDLLEFALGKMFSMCTRYTRHYAQDSSVPGGP